MRYECIVYIHTVIFLQNWNKSSTFFICWYWGTSAVMITDLQPPTVGLRSPIVTTPRPNGCCSCLIDNYAASAWIHLCFYQRSKRICGLHWPIFLSNSLMVWGNGWLNKCQLSNVKAITTYHASGQSNDKPNNIPSLKGIEINVLSSLEVVSIGGVAISHPWKMQIFPRCVGLPFIMTIFSYNQD